MKYFFSVFILFLAFGFAGNVFATHGGNPSDHQRTNTGQSGQQTGTGLAGQQTPVGQSNSIIIKNPIKAKNITQLFESIIDILLVFAVPLIAFFIIYAGFLYVTARGNEEKIKTAHMALLYALIGGVLILGAKVLISVIGGTIDSITGSLILMSFFA